MTEVVSLEQRRRTLEAALLSLTQKGWVISSRTDTTAQLTRSGKKSGCLLLILLIFGILPGILYAVWPASQETMFVIVNEQGEAHFSGSAHARDPVLEQQKSLGRKMTRLVLLEGKQRRATRDWERAVERSIPIAKWTAVWLGLLCLGISWLYLRFLHSLGPPSYPEDIVWILLVAVPWLLSLALLFRGWNPVAWWWKGRLESLRSEIPMLVAQIREGSEHRED